MEFEGLCHPPRPTNGGLCQKHAVFEQQRSTDPLRYESHPDCVLTLALPDLGFAQISYLERLQEFKCTWV